MLLYNQLHGERCIKAVTSPTIHYIMGNFNIQKCISPLFNFLEEATIEISTYITEDYFYLESFMKE